MQWKHGFHRDLGEFFGFYTCIDDRAYEKIASSPALFFVAVQQHFLGSTTARRSVPP